eukprot:9484981-Pyramimonas_sp.AAC.1
MLDLRGGSGGISQLAYSRGLSSGGNLDKRALVDIGNKDVQDAAMHYLDACVVKVVIRKPNCRTTGFISRLNAISGMNIINKICHISSYVGRWLYARTISDDSTYENNQWGL